MISDRLSSAISLFLRPGTVGERDAARRACEKLAMKEGFTFAEALDLYHDRMPGDFRRVFEVWLMTGDEDDRAHARADLEAFARKSGRTFKQVFDELVGGFGLGPFDHIEARREADCPGHKAERARERREKIDALAQRRADVIARFSSEDAAWQPCDAERMLIDALGDMRKVQPNCPRWTDSVAGWIAWRHDDPPPHVEAMLRAAIPFPTTLAEAEAEWNYWRERDNDLGALLGDDSDTHLDGIVRARVWLVEKALETELPARTVADVAIRVRYFRYCESTDDRRLGRIFEDIETLAAKPTESSVRPASEQIEAALRADPKRTDRAIAREFGCSPTTVGKVRREIGLDGVKRTVRRGRQEFEAEYWAPAAE